MAKTPLQRFVAALRPENGAHVDRFLEEKSQIYRTLRSSQFQAWSAQTLSRFPQLKRLAHSSDPTAGHTILRALSIISDTDDPVAMKATAVLLDLPPTTPRDEVMATAAATFGYETGRAFERGVVEPFRTANASDNLALRTFVHDDARERASLVDKAIPDPSPRVKEQATDAQERRNLIDTYARRAEASRPPFEAAKASLYHPSTERQVDVERSFAALSGERSMVAANSDGSRRWEKATAPEDRVESDVRLETIRGSVESAVRQHEAQEASVERTPIEGAFIADVGEQGRAFIPPEGFGSEFKGG